MPRLFFNRRGSAFFVSWGSGLRFRMSIKLLVGDGLMPAEVLGRLVELGLVLLQNVQGLLLLLHQLGDLPVHRGLGPG